MEKATVYIILSDTCCLLYLRINQPGEHGRLAEVKSCPHRGLCVWLSERSRFLAPCSSFHIDRQVPITN